MRRITSRFCQSTNKIEELILKANSANARKLPEQYLQLFRQGSAAAGKRDFDRARKLLQEARQSLPPDNKEELAFINAEIDRLPISDSFWNTRNVTIIGTTGLYTLYQSYYPKTV